MSESTLASASIESVLLGDEAVALGAVHAGASAAYAYPGTPSTEILEYLQQYAVRHGHPRAAWCANEKTAYEQALGVSMAGRRVLVSMKHVGLNVAADPFMNSALVGIDGGLVVVVADDPGMHSSQNEQDSRYMADFARIPCLEPADQQEAYDMTREAFEISERFKVPVMLRLVTRLAHSRAAVTGADPIPENGLRDRPDKADWTLLPAFARRLWRELLRQQDAIRASTESSPYNRLRLNESNRALGVITTGLARNYYLENLADLGEKPSHLHIGAYPIPVQRVRLLADHVDRILVLEDGYPFLERYLRGILPTPVRILGKETGQLPLDGELTPDHVRVALELPARDELTADPAAVPQRPPQLCRGCPHGDTYTALGRALEPHEHALVANDIGCYTLGMLPPHSIGESCVCMGASIGMAKGASEAGKHPSVAVIGDSTFLHSGVTGLMDAVTADSNMTVVIMDNETVAMTGIQPTVLPSSSLEKVVLGLGVPEEHCHHVIGHPKRVPELTELFEREIAHNGLSVVIVSRECLEKARKMKSNEVPS